MRLLDGVYIRSRGGRLFDVKGLVRDTVVLRQLLIDLCFADDMALLAHSERTLQELVDRLAKAWPLAW
jgi:hypothetical protein